MKRKLLTRKDIQKDLLAKLNKAKVLVIFFSIIIIFLVILYSIHLINYINGTPFENNHSYRFPSMSESASIFFIPLVIIFFIGIVVNNYFIDLYKIKKGKFTVTEMILWDKETEWVHGYHSFTKENRLHFPYITVVTDEDTYKHARKGERFYVVSIKQKWKQKRNSLAYSTKIYEYKND